MTHYTLAAFEAWCNGEGRAGSADGQPPGIHWSALKMIENFKRFKQEQRDVQETTRNADRD